MKACLICNRGNEAGSACRFLDDVVLSEADRGTLRDRLERVLHEAVCQDGCVCAPCQAELKRIETYYTLINDFKQQYWDTRKQQQTQEPNHRRDKGVQRNGALGGDHTYDAGVSLQGSPPDVESDADHEQGSVADPSDNDDTQKESGGETYKPGVKESHRGQNRVRRRRLSTAQHAERTSAGDSNSRGQKTVSAGSVRPYMCAACDASFTQPRNLSTHIREAHTPSLTPTQNGRYVCNFCSKAHSTAGQLVRHVRLHTRDKPYKCGICHKVYTDLGHLKDHMGLHTVHRFPCPVCQRVLGTRHSLQGHMARMHGRRIRLSPTTSSLRRYKPLIVSRTREAVEKDAEAPGTAAEDVDTLTTEDSILDPGTHTEGEKQPEELQLNEQGLQVSDVYPVYIQGQGYVCSICNKAFRWPAQYERHARVHTGERRHRCTVCGRGYKEASHLKSHMDTHAGYIFSCPECHREHGTHVSLRIHMRKFHPDAPVPRAATFRLKQNPEASAPQAATFTSHSESNTHRPGSASPKPAAPTGSEVEAAKSAAPTDSEVAAAEVEEQLEGAEGEQEQPEADSKTEGAEEDAQLSMEVTDETLSLIADDTDSVPTSQPEIVVCQVVTYNDSAEVPTLQSEIVVCGVAASDDGEEGDRAPTAVPGAVEGPSLAKPHVCWECGKGFRNSIELKRHELVHTGLRPHQCGTCGKTYKHLSHLNTHMKTHSNLSFLCPTCGLTVTTKTGLNNHMKLHDHGALHMKHEKALQARSRSHVCAVCDKVYVSARNLEVHGRTHRGERPYSCRVCGKAFTTQSHLNQHSVRHSDLRPYSCPTCGKSFKYRSQIKVHQKVHSREPAVCTDCGKQCRDQASLLNHQRSHADSSTGRTYLPLPQDSPSLCVL